MVADQRQHDGGLVVGIEVGPIHGHHNGVACANDEWHPAHQNIVHVDGGVGEQPVDLLDCMLGLQTARCGQALANGADQRARSLDTPGVADRR